MPLTFTVSKISDWHFQFGDLDSVSVRSIGPAWEITLSTADPEISRYGIGVGSSLVEASDAEEWDVRVTTLDENVLRESIDEESVFNKFFKELDKDIDEEATGGEDLAVVTNHFESLSVPGVDRNHSENSSSSCSRSSLTVSRTSAGITMKSGARSPEVWNPQSTFDINEFLEEFGKKDKSSKIISDGASTSEKLQPNRSCPPGNLDTKSSGEILLQNALASACQKPEMHQSLSDVLRTGEPSGASCSTSSTLPTSGKCNNCHPTPGGLEGKGHIKWFDPLTSRPILSHIETPKSPGLPPPVLVNVKRPAPPVPKNRAPFWGIAENKATGPPATYREMKTFPSPARRPISVDDVPSQSGNLLPRPPRTRPYTFVDPSTVEWPESSTTTKKAQKPEQENKKSFWSRKTKKEKKDKRVDVPKPKSEAEDLEIVWMKKKK
ncbi:unnamed protein product [Caenorhabditis brenneri]